MSVQKKMPSSCPPISVDDVIIAEDSTCRPGSSVGSGRRQDEAADWMRDDRARRGTGDRDGARSAREGEDRLSSVAREREEDFSPHAREGKRGRARGIATGIRARIYARADGIFGNLGKITSFTKLLEKEFCLFYQILKMATSFTKLLEML